jgi:molecular chaperone GrpE
MLNMPISIGMTDAPETPAPEPEVPNREAELEKQLAEAKDQLLRTLAEGENTRRRLEKDKDESNKYAVAQFAKELIGVADNLRRAIEAVPQEGREGAVANLLVGVEATERQFLAGLDKFGVKRMTPEGKVFDPNFHQVMFESESDQPPGTVLQVLQHGYTIADRLLRPALVAVAKAGATKTDTSA